nr:hypothetical protein CFP56_49781 [Quercus suber]
MLQGSITHQDSAGHKDTIGPCDVQVISTDFRRSVREKFLLVWLLDAMGVIHQYSDTQTNGGYSLVL